ncbi:receptor kinase-like protein Xa21 [Salvia splendens]|uniref:receptor kinase-like protein Xa21 n=1 Tax=Salvia splendens TaxID=180675 RepID=UPI001C276849|nr:receptor kinase-like protein Xa21 [Salvia splendens]
MELPHRVTAINLRNMGFEGTIAKEIGNLTFLRFVDMSNNSISGPIPAEVGNLRQLRVLNMESNQLTEGIPQSLGLLRKLQGLNLSNNNLIGVTPISLSGCVELRKLDLSHNNLSGYVPAGFWNWSQLEELSLSRNYLTGTVPASIGNLSNLEVFDISRNSFYGTVVSELGQLSSLRILNLQANNLSDEVPQAIFNISMLRFLSLRENNLSGSLPFSIDKGLPNIEHILIGNIERRFNLRANQFYGKIPNSVSNLSKLITLDLSDNSFTHIPIDLGSLHQLQKLNLQANQLMNNLSDPGQDFLSSLVACKNLKSIQISFNPITGVLPKSLGSSNLSTSLETLKAFSCRLSYPIPDEIGNLSNLWWLDLGYNHLTGAIPSTLGQLRSLRNLRICGNRFHGSISPVLCNFKHLYSLNVAINSLSGQLPSCFVNLSSLREVYMSDNEFNGSIASIPWFLKNVSNVKNLVALDLSRNQLSGEIPNTISQLENLVRLSLSSNKLKGPILESLTVLKDLQYLDLSHNNLSGLIPKSLEALSHLHYFDVSFNELSGEIPDRGCFVNFTSDFFIGNNGLCGSPRFEVKKCQSLSTRKSLSYLSFFIVLVIGLIFVLMWKFSARKPSPLSDEVGQDMFRGISHQAIVCATDNFDDRNLIGKGGIGSVYMGRFSDKNVYAIKVYDLDVQDALRSFHTECRIFGKVRHRNIVKIIGCCSQIDFMALVMEYMPNGDLEHWLYSSSCSLGLFTRLRIMTEVACAIQYLHECSTVPIVHCDLNPKNIFLGEDLVVHVGDFGISKFLSEEERMLRSRTLGTVGYVAPEYGSQGLITTTVDIYSYGVLLMEMLSRRKPTDEMFSGELSLRRWISEAFPNSVLQILDNEMLDKVDEEARVVFRPFLTSAIELALECTADLPEERPSITYVLNRITDVLSSMRKILIQFKNLGMSISLIDSDQAGPSSRSDRTPKLWLQIEENDTQLAAVFSSTYRHMPPDMRKCFLYMASFPEDYEIHVSELIKLWVAKGFLECQNEHKSLEDKGKYVLKLLVQKGLVSVIRSDDKIISCRLHRVVWNFCQRQAKEDKFFLPVVD